MAEEPNKRQSDEIDLGQVFVMIGRGFAQLFNAIGNVFLFLGKALLLALVFLYRNFLILIIAIISGLALGLYLESVRPEIYVSKMLVEPNFRSVQELYNSVEFYDNLAQDEDSMTLARLFEIEPEQASKFKEFRVESYADENQKIRLFDEFVRSLDTTTTNYIDLKNYLENFNSLDARFHSIVVYSEDAGIVKEIQPALINNVSQNAYFKRQKEVADLNFKIEDSLILVQLKEIDSLLSLYRTIMIKEAEKPTSTTTITLSEKNDPTLREIDLLNERESLKSDLVRLNQEKLDKSEIINVISEFPDKGVRSNTFWNGYTFILSSLFFGLTVLILLVIRLVKFLKEYSANVNV